MKRRLLVAVLVVGMYVAALYLPAMITQKDGRQVLTGLDGLLLGIFWPGILSWLANVALLFGGTAYLAGKQQFAFWCGVAGTVLSASAPLLYEEPLSSLRIGFFMWVLCSIVVAFQSRHELLSNAGGGKGQPSNR